ncbi:MAG: esterase-like activity of phytase family protein [Prevotella sp.]|nr:esterase-like activity of phytase family protein [Prevotella sp.]
MMKLKLLIVALLFTVSLSVSAQLLHENRQQKFPKDIPAGNYSGITALGNDRYAVVCDKSVDGFFVFHIDIDSVSGRIVSVANEGIVASGSRNRDQEAVAYRPSSHTLFVSGEADNQVLEYSLQGKRTGRSLAVPHLFGQLERNYGLEALCYDSISRRFFAMSERPVRGDSLLRLAVFDDNGRLLQMYAYNLDAVPQKRRGVLVNGVSELCALGDDRLLVLERTVRVPPLRIGAYVETRLYIVCPEKDSLLQKTLLCRFRTRLNIMRQNFANYEGMCVARRLADGRKIILLIADSQNQYKGLLRDWLKTLIIR